MAPDDCEIRRLTVNNDLRNRSGLKAAYRAITGASSDMLIWASIPCAGGSQLIHVNRAIAAKHDRPSTIEKIEQHVRDFQKIWKNVVKVAQRASRKGARIVFGRPSNCAHWKGPEVIQFVNSLGMAKAKFDGCIFGLQDSERRPLLKPWSLMTDDQALFVAFDGVRCFHEKSADAHRTISGQLAKSIELYTERG
jgi:hypothetical protein